MVLVWSSFLQVEPTLGVLVAMVYEVERVSYVQRHLALTRDAYLCLVLGSLDGRRDGGWTVRASVRCLGGCLLGGGCLAVTLWRGGGGLAVLWKCSCEAAKGKDDDSGELHWGMHFGS